jgi:hypothetical protein
MKKILLSTICIFIAHFLIVNGVNGQVSLPYFDNFEDGNFDNWNLSGTGLSVVVIDSTAANGTGHSLYTENVGSSEFDLTLTLEEGAQPNYVGFYAKSGSTSLHDAYFTLKGSSDWLIYFYFYGTGNMYLNGLYPYSYNTWEWYHIEFKDIDYVGHTFDFYVNETLILDDTPFRTNNSSVTGIWIRNYDAGGIGIFDEIQVGGILVGYTPICAGDDAVFTVNYTGVGTTTYQWQESADTGKTFTDLTEGEPYSGVDNDTLIVADGASMEGYQYRVVIDDDEGSDTTSAITLVLESEAPELVTQNSTIYLNDNGIADIIPGDIILSATDNCELTDTVFSKSTFSCEDIGDNEIDVSVTDVSGNTTTNQVTITVEDTLGPSLVMEDIILQLDTAGNAVITAEDIITELYDNCMLADTVIDITTFDCSDIGDVVVTVTVTDSSGNETVSEATVTIEDALPPEISTVDTLRISLDEDEGATIEIGDVLISAADNCELADTGLSESAFNCDDSGMSEITITVTDVSGNEAINTIIVIISENEIPELVTQKTTVSLSPEGTASILASDVVQNASDNCRITDTIMSKALFGCEDIGENIIDITVIDASGNEITLQDTVVVNDFDTDGDGTGNCTDTDDDDDGIPDIEDPDPLNPNIPSVVNNAEASSFTVYPNPFDDVIHLSFGTQVNNVQISVLTMEGKIVRTIDKFSGTEATVSTSGLKQGIYFIYLVNGEICHKYKIIKE